MPPTTSQVPRVALRGGVGVIPKSVTPTRIEENFDAFDFELGAEEMDAIAALERVGRIGPDPDTFVRPEAGHAGGAGGARVGALTRAGGAPRVVAEHETRVDDEVLIPP